MANKFAEKMKKKAAESPAMMFITQPAEEPEETWSPEPEEKTSARTVEPEPRIREETPYLKAPRAPHRGEAKTRRLQLLLTPSLYEAVKVRAEAEGLSVNEEISELLRSALQR